MAHDADIDLERARSAEALELALLEHAQDLGLRDQREVGHLVEEERAAVRELEASFLASRGAGERALLVSEQLGLEERLGQRRAVDGDERAVAPSRALVDRARHQLLPGAALALDQNRRRAVGDLLDEGQHAAEGGARADHLPLGANVLELLLESPVLLDQVAPLERLVDQLDELLAPERLGREVVGAVLHRLHGFLDGAEGGQQDHVDVRHDRLGGPQELEPGEARHPEVGDDEVDAAGLNPFQRRSPVRGEHHPIAFAGQGALEALPQAGVVIGDEQSRGLSHPSLA